MHSASDEIILKGIAASAGVAHGPVQLFLRKELDIPQRAVPPEHREEEIARFERGLMETRRQISAIRAEIEEKLGDEEAAIFDAHQLVLEDRALIEETIREVIESGCNIEYCFQRVANRYIDAFSRIEDEYLKERVADIRDVSRRLLCTLLGINDSGLGRLTAPAVIVGDDLTPSDTANLDKSKVLAIITDLGSRTSHAVIMARSIDIPCVVGLKNITDLVRPGEVVLVDGMDGVVIVNPGGESLHRYGKLREEREFIRRRFYEAKDLPSETRDGRPICLRLNIDGNEDLPSLKYYGGTGVGLFRTEGLFLNSHGFPDEEAQYQAYRRVIEAMAPHSVTIRTLDLGGDKNPHNSLYGYEEANPFMGFRAIRFCLENPEVFKEQLRAILRASAFGPVKVMYPMISSCEEVIAANHLLEDCRRELRAAGVAFDEGMEVGSMIEIPSAAVITDLLADHCDFFSIGTNDLIQYLLAVDRVNDRIAHLYEPNHPAVMRTLQFIFKAGHVRGIPVSVCGEMAGDPLYAALLVGMGATELSLSGSLLPAIKYLIRSVSQEQCRSLAQEVLKARTPAEISARLQAFYRDATGIDIGRR